MRVSVPRLALLVPLLAGMTARATPQPVHFDVSLLDPSKDPCTDFYAYACSRWLTNNPIPGDEQYWDTGSPLNLWSRAILRETLEAASRPDPTRPPNDRLIGDAWAACMDEPRIEAAGIAPIRADLDRIAHLADRKGIARELARQHLAAPGAWDGGDNGTNAVLFGFGSSQDLNDASLVVLGIDQGGTALPGRDHYLSDEPRMKELRAKYLVHLERMFTLAGEPAAVARRSAASVLEMETALARASMDNVKRRDPKNLNNVRSLAQIKAATPSFDWAAYLSAVGAPRPKHYLVSAPEFLAGMEALLKARPVSDWRAYLSWWTLHQHAPLLSKAFVDENFDFFGHTLGGAEQLLPRWRRCVSMADRDLGEALGEAYVRRAFPPESKRRVDELVRNVRAALAADIDTLDWMGPETRKAAHVKLDAIEEKIGYPMKWRDYSTVKIDRTSLVGNVRSASAFELHRQLAKVGKPVDRTEWTMTPPTVNAYYSSQLNTINFPAGILQPPYFDPVQDEAVNYGAIGSVIGHEITHGFDDQGRKFDAEGNLRDWWTPADAAAYEQRGKCISDLYTHDMPSLGVKTNGLLTQGEDTADNGGVRIALAALDRALAAAGKKADTQGADGLSAHQRFFAGYAVAWCMELRPEFARTIIQTNPHSLGEYRVNYVLMNVPQFAQAFSCPAGKPMVRANACRVW